MIHAQDIDYEVRWRFDSICENLAKMLDSVSDSDRIYYRDETVKEIKKMEEYVSRIKPNFLAGKY